MVHNGIIYELSANQAAIQGLENKSLKEIIVLLLVQKSEKLIFLTM